MKSFFSIGKKAVYLPIILSVIFVGSCKKENVGEGNGLKTDLQASFTIAPVEGRLNTYLVKNTTDGTLATKWDFDKETGFSMGKMTDTIFYPDAGTYSVNMQAMGKGGLFYDAAAQPVTVATSDPVAGNLVQGGKFNAGDEAKWTTHPISVGVNIAMENSKMVATGGSWGHAAFYQAIQVQANKKYKFSMIVSGSGATDTWFEVYFGTAAPVANSDYKSGGIQIALNTWDGCGNTTFNGNLADIGCAGSLVGKKGEITFSQTGTIYLFIKTGGANLGTSGISIDNVELRGM
jgi:hypothetical protein